MSEDPQKDRLDRWLWQARFFKTRSLAAQMVSDARVRLDGEKVSKPATQVGPGAVLTFPQGRQIRVIRIKALAKRRGPATEARELYTDLTPAEVSKPARVGPRPTKKHRRDLTSFRRSE